MITKIDQYKHLLESVEFISLDKLIEIADKAGEIIPDAKGALEELGVAYGERIPKPLVDDILFNYDIQDINESKAKNKYVSNKISTLMDEGKPHKQAVAIAISMWEQKQKKKRKKVTEASEHLNLYTELLADIIIKHMKCNNMYKDKVVNFVDKELNSVEDLKDVILNDLTDAEIEKILLMI